MTGFTLVVFHAHPDDEVALTGGTMAAAAAAGHRVVLVVATRGEAGLTGDPDAARSLGSRRWEELQRAATILGCHRVEWLGYADSGLDRAAGDDRAFAAVDPDEAATRLAHLLREERADALTIYDRSGGYGHPDHLQVHVVGHRAAVQAATPVVLEATVDRRPLLRLARAARVVPGLPPEFRSARLQGAYADPDAITHEVDVGAFLGQKRAAMAAHGSQTTGGATPRSLAAFLRLPSPLFGMLFRREWFAEQGRVPGATRLDDVFATLRSSTSVPA
jgi:LmbE family N-acetylglucosaminyl deacetylase